MAGHQPYRLVEGRLQLSLRPILPHWLFDENNEVAFRFIGKTKVIYHNPHRRNTYEGSSSIHRIEVLYRDGSEISIERQGTLSEPYATDIRCGKIEKLYIEYL